ncbi:MAG: tRNA (guanosine(46)-N7)-methyltransferase TrmB [Rhodospirillaceae bacterium]|jgi:tRNA (guanine-N7-)-methyltransferase|nr:tRNA (guanosine(46)-N7)-methyltransferase TrmB [Rhodospirillaceae bacterium]
MIEDYSIEPDVKPRSTGTQRALYGRRKGRPLRPHRQRLVDRLLPAIEIALSPDREPLDPQALFGVAIDDVWLEIGFGAGEHLAWQARENRHLGIIGCEPYLNGVARLLSDIDTDELENVRLYRDDARMLLERLPEASISRAFVLFPDPWPKSRHNKRRIIGPATMPHLARLLRDGAELRVATDDFTYKGWILEHVLGSGYFQWTARCPSDWRDRPADWPPTRYEAKALRQGRRGTFMRFLRNPR